MGLGHGLIAVHCLFKHDPCGVGWGKVCVGNRAWWCGECCNRGKMAQQSCAVGNGLCHIKVLPEHDLSFSRVRYI